MGPTVMYGGAPFPYQPQTPVTPYVPPIVPVYPESPNTIGTKITLDPRTQAMADADTKRRLRVTTLKGDDGEIRLKVYLDGVLVSESITDGGSTLTVETDI